MKIVEMKENRKDTTNVPNLRFPEFDGEWEEKKLAQITSKIGSGKTPKGGEEVYTNEGIPFIRSQNVINDSLILDSTHIPQDVHESMKGSKVLPNDILLNITGGSIGRSCVVPEGFNEGNVNQHVSIIRLKNDNPRFLQPILSSWRGQKLVFQGMTGSGREGLNFESIKGFKIHFPSVAEQNKIASLLTVLDERIQTQNKIIEHQESLMKGLMQQIFSQQLRLKDSNGNDFPDWEVKKIKDICEKGASNISANTLGSNSGEYKIYGATGYLQNVDFYQEEEAYISIVKDGAGAGRTLICEAKSSVLGTLDKIKPKNNNNLYFLYLRLKTINFEKYITGSTIPHIYFRDYGNEKIKQPCIEEQTTIANFISSLDEKLEKEKQIFAQYKQQKKHLLQNLFV